jgi:hypothetical protein
MASPNSGRKKQTTPGNGSSGAKVTRTLRVDNYVAPERCAYNSPDAAMTYAFGGVFPSTADRADLQRSTIQVTENKREFELVPGRGT